MLEQLLANQVNKTNNHNNPINRRKPAKPKQIKKYALFLHDKIVSIHASYGACIAALKYLKRNDVCMSKYREHYTYDEVRAMRIREKQTGFTIERS